MSGEAARLKGALIREIEADLLSRFKGAGPKRRQSIKAIAAQTAMVMELEHRAVINNRPDEAITAVASASKKLAVMLKALSSPGQIAGTTAVAILGRAYFTVNLALGAEPPAGSA